MKLTKVTISPQSGRGTMHEVPRLRTKVRGADKGTDKPRPLEDIYSLGMRNRACSWGLNYVSTLASRPARPWSTSIFYRARNWPLNYVSILASQASEH